MSKAISLAALVVSLAALALSVFTYLQADARVDARVEEALRRREKALVERAKPTFTKIFNDFQMKDVPENPQTLDDLFEPLLKLMVGLSK